MWLESGSCLNMTETSLDLLLEVASILKDVRQGCSNLSSFNGVFPNGMPSQHHGSLLREFLERHHTLYARP